MLIDGQWQNTREASPNLSITFTECSKCCSNMCVGLNQSKWKWGVFDLEDRQNEPMHRNSAEKSISIDCQTIIKHIQDAPKNSAKAITITYHSPSCLAQVQTLWHSIPLNTYCQELWCNKRNSDTETSTWYTFFNTIRKIFKLQIFTNVSR